MSSVRLYARQIQRFAPGTGALVIACAVRRYQAGEIVIQPGRHADEPGNVLQLFPIRRKPPFADSLLRDILDAHFDTPRAKLELEIQQLDRIIAEMFRQLPSYIIEETGK
ncbi:MAG: hypothetical protein HPZ91_07355 [Lentisphaeria bacterium]|nr:hypothetical protein [Lentisphaeria bacterium]